MLTSNTIPVKDSDNTEKVLEFMSNNSTELTNRVKRFEGLKEEDFLDLETYIKERGDKMLTDKGTLTMGKDINGKDIKVGDFVEIASGSDTIYSGFVEYSLDKLAFLVNSDGATILLSSNIKYTEIKNNGN